MLYTASFARKFTVTLIVQQGDSVKDDLEIDKSIVAKNRYEARLAAIEKIRFENPEINVARIRLWLVYEGQKPKKSMRSMTWL